MSHIIKTKKELKYTTSTCTVTQQPMELTNNIQRSFRSANAGLVVAVVVVLTTTMMIGPCHSFSPRLLFTNHLSRKSTSPSLVLLQMAKSQRKPSMAEKRKQRQAKQRGATSINPFADLPKSKLDFQESAASAVLDNAPAQRIMSDPVEAASKAKELLKTQRASVDMLTMVREKVESLPSEELTLALERDGYYVVDGFLGEETILAQMESEADKLYTDGALEVDMSNLGSGEYTVAVKGGTEQYASCPRMVEWVVSTTKHVPEIATPSSLSLDPRACMATLRTFDRKAFKASLALLTGSEEIPEETTTSKKPFRTIVTDAKEDKRRLTLQYYLVPGSWDETCGGGLSFESGGGVMVQAKRDRLVVWKSDTSAFRKEVWKGTDEMPVGSCLELHLVQKSE